MPATLSSTETINLLGFSAACFLVLAHTFQGDGEPLIASLALSGVAFSFAFGLIRWLGGVFMAAGLKGKDMSKARRPELCGSFGVLVGPMLTLHSPEAMGAVCAIVYLLIIIVFIPFPFYKDIVAATSGGGNRDVVVELQQVETGRLLHRFPHSKVGTAPLLLPPLTETARHLPVCHPFAPVGRPSRHWR
jgi:UDP-N-acetylglucosamine--dolichyl-phosphate N-acetylglucosaminephosphotransferase